MLGLIVGAFLGAVLQDRWTAHRVQAHLLGLSKPAAQARQLTRESRRRTIVRSAQAIALALLVYGAGELLVHFLRAWLFVTNANGGGQP